MKRDSMRKKKRIRSREHNEAVNFETGKKSRIENEEDKKTNE